MASQSSPVAHKLVLMPHQVLDLFDETREDDDDDDVEDCFASKEAIGDVNYWSTDEDTSQDIPMDPHTNCDPKGMDDEKWNVFFSFRML